MVDSGIPIGGSPPPPSGEGDPPPQRERRSSGTRVKRRRRALLFLSVVACILYVLLVWDWATGGAVLRGSRREVLVLYVFANTDPEFVENLKYFVAEAVERDPGVCDYVIAVQRSHGLQLEYLPPLPPHGRYIFHDNVCYDWGTFGWLLMHSGHVNHKQYRYFFFINSSVRGPFMPPYARGLLHWAEPFLARLDGSVKLVGPTISCEGSPLDGDRKGVWRRNPHVQSYVVATDRVGLQLLIDDRRVFQCHRDRWNTIYYSELGSSAAILDAGYNLDCLMVRYQGVDWRDKANWDCNARLTATSEFSMDGVSVDPLEVMFVKVKSYMLTSEWSFSKKAAKYQEWQRQQDERYLERARAGGGRPANLTTAAALSRNEAVTDRAKFRVPRVLEMRARGARCFDFDFYTENNPDLAVLGTGKEDIWRHFVYNGQFEARRHRFTCESINYEQLTAW